MSDLVKRLKDRSRDYYSTEITHQLLVEAAAEITRLTAELAEAEERPLTPKAIAELIRGKVARFGRLEKMQENTRFYSEGDWSVTPGNIPRPTKPCVVIRLTEDEAAALEAMVRP